MTDERDPSARPNPPRAAETDNGAGSGDGMREAPPREPQQRPFGDQDPAHRGPRRSRYGRRRSPNDGPGEAGGGGGYQQDGRPQQRTADPAGEDVENYLPSFIAGPTSGPVSSPVSQPSNGPMNGGQDHQASHNPQSHNPNQGQPNHNASHQAGGHGHQHQPSHQQHQPVHQGNQGNPGMNQNHGGGHQPMQHGDHQQSGHQQSGHQQGGHQGGGHQVAPQAPVIEEPSPEVQAAAAAFAEWEESNPKLRGLLMCNPTVKRGEPIVRGTRIPARILAAIAKMGSTVEEMLQDYPALTREGLDAALAFATAIPRQPR